MTYRQKRNDTKLKNIKGLPDEVMDKYRNDATLGYVLDKERVVSKNQLMRKYSNNNC